MQHERPDADRNALTAELETTGPESLNRAVVHDLCGLLTIVQGNAELLLSARGPDAGRQHALEILAACQRGASLIHALRRSAGSPSSRDALRPATAAGA